MLIQNTRIQSLRIALIVVCGLLVSCKDPKNCVHLSCTTNNSSSHSTHNQKLDTAIEKEIDTLMSRTGATAVTISVAKKGIIQYDKAFGFKDVDKKIPLTSDALMRTASIVKPVTAAAIHKLANYGLLSLSDHAFCTGNNNPCWLSSSLLSATSDPRVADITIQHLIDHQGGRTRENDPLGGEAECQNLSIPCPPTRKDIVKYMMSLPLDFTPGDPGNLDGYSNFGYLVLGMIIEQASRTSYINYVNQSVFAQLGISNQDFKGAKSLPQFHDSREPNYISTETDSSVYHLGVQAPVAEEGFVAENWYAAGSSITTARAMALFASSYKLPYGEALPRGATNDGVHWGNMDGSSTIVRQLTTGASYSIFINISIDINDFPGLQKDLDEICQLDF